MWGTFLSEPLRIVALVGRYPANKLMRRMPIPVRIAPFLAGRCLPAMYAVLARLSPGCTPDGGRLHTCYSPVRRSPAVSASTDPAAPRLACVKPAASVHPEPGSNSPLLVYIFRYLLFSFVLSLGSVYPLCQFIGTVRFDGKLMSFPVIVLSVSLVASLSLFFA